MEPCIPRRQRRISREAFALGLAPSLHFLIDAFKMNSQSPYVSLSSSHRLALIAAFGFASFPTASADWKDDIGHTQLANELGAALPTGAGVNAIIVEAASGSNYLPQTGSTQTFAGTGSFTGTTFVNVTNTNNGQSGHANTVGKYFFGDTSSSPNSVAPGIDTVYCYLADTWLGSDFLQADDGEPGNLPGPGIKVQSNAWVSESDVENATDYNNLLRRVDLVIERDGILVVGAPRNGPTSTLPALMASAYNTITVARRDANHSQTGVIAQIDGPGRTKPEVVIPASATSWNSGQMASVGAFLYEVANTSAALQNAWDQPEVMKAIIMAGATKDEFPGWSRTASAPLDAVYGAGEVNLYNSYHLLTGGEQSGSGLPLRGWHYQSNLGIGSTATYAFTIPSDRRVSQFSASLNWNRQITVTQARPLFLNPPVFTPTLPDLDLALYRETLAGDVLVAQSASQDDNDDTYNLEYLFERDLPPGDYRLEVTHVATSPAATDYAIAWFSEEAAPPSIQVAADPASGDVTLTLDGLHTGTPFEIEGSTNLTQWDTVTTLTPASASETVDLIDELVNYGKRFYRLGW